MIQHLKEHYKYDELEASSSYLALEVFEEMIKRTLSQKMGVVLMESEGIQFNSDRDNPPSSILANTRTITAHLIVVPEKNLGDLMKVLNYVTQHSFIPLEVRASAERLIGEPKTFQP